ncbi:signal recognition particle-docking protein FtsY [Dermatobacter hominis]|uniref:signal recognition particle-docking protein FtsY n=1 Tax=Dermatobacter hominis TaxID=2884263 RepID=UPI001D11AB4F|nr:signal recognition particle-docking protein FtsY [Dermatobacter hominis]UDY36884.1 signal recognition particle-docking protein FtsY [Dermatobacter hominis]
MEPLVILAVILAVVAVLAVVAGATLVSRRGRGESLEPPPDGDLDVVERPGPEARAPRKRAKPDDPGSLSEPEVEVIEPRGTMFGGTVEITGPELTDEEEAANIAAAEAAEAEWETDHGAGVEELVRPSFRDRLARARSAFSGYVGSIMSRSTIDAETWDDLEEALIRADVGIGTAQDLLESVRSTVKERGLTTPDELIEAVKEEMKARLAGPVDLAFADAPPTVWLFVGVNGVGKTTTIGKLGRRLADEDKRVVMAAGDTFRAAAAEQLSTWAERAGADIVRGAEGGDPSSIIFDAIASASAKGADVVLADTAGRLHTKSNLMDELGKVRRVADKGDGTVTEVLLVLDATTGQNGLQQARQFTEATDVTGVVLTKLDGSAKGGIVFAIRSELGIPIKLVGLGETAADLVDFDADEFVEALFSA